MTIKPGILHVDHEGHRLRITYNFCKPDRELHMLSILSNGQEVIHRISDKLYGEIHASAVEALKQQELDWQD